MVDDDRSLRDVVRDLLLEIGCDAVRFAAIDEVQAPARLPSGFDMIVLDLARASRLQRYLHAEHPNATLVTIRNGNYETILEATFVRLCRRESATRHM